MRSVTPLTYGGVTATVITESRAVALLRRVSPRTGAFVLGRSVRLYRSVRAYLAGAVSTSDRQYRTRAIALLLAHEWGHVLQFERLGWRFLPRWGAQVVGGLWRSLTAKGRAQPWYLRPFEFLNQCAKIGPHMRTAYKTAPLEREADLFAATHVDAFLSLVESLP